MARMMSLRLVRYCTFALLYSWHHNTMQTEVVSIFNGHSLLLFRAI